MTELLQRPTRLSSRVTYLYKRVLPMVWATLGGLSLMRHEAWELAAPVPVLPSSLLGVAVLGFLLMVRLVAPLADEVVDLEDRLLVRRGNETEVVDLALVADVRYESLVSPPRVVLELHWPSRFGREIAFVPSGTRVLGIHPTNPIATDLRERVAWARVPAAVPA